MFLVANYAGVIMGFNTNTGRRERISSSIKDTQ